MQFTTRRAACITLVYHPLAAKTYYDEESIMSDSDFKPKQANPASGSQASHQGYNETDSNGVVTDTTADTNAKSGVAKSGVAESSVNMDMNSTDVSGNMNSEVNNDVTVSASSSPPQILIAEDEYLIAASIRDALMRYSEPLNVVVVQRSNMLVDNINNLKPDVLLMDITLKGAMDGIEAIQHIKAAGRDIPVIYITADSRITTLERAETTNPVAYLIKPFREADLHKALTKALEQLEN
jgi:CheY-like chemotaxis protein